VCSQRGGGAYSDDSDDEDEDDDDDDVAKSGDDVVGVDANGESAGYSNGKGRRGGGRARRRSRDDATSANVAIGAPALPSFRLTTGARGGGSGVDRYGC
jgi:hypothetical protein